MDKFVNNRMIDEIDRQILMLLQMDARISNAAIAERVGLTTSTVHDRVKKLERKGIIRGYVALVDAELLDKSISAFIRLTVGSGTTNYLESKESIKTVCEAESDVIECHAVAGEDCYVMKARVANPQELERLIERIRCNAPVSRSTTSIVLSTLKETTFVTPD
jgi:Lrp/AsnC family leucine-responsive transcriptional regulator